jgi:hypothetical protein
VSSTAPSVTVVGGGIAGMTAALRLAQRGYRVKLYEQMVMLGGNLATRTLLTGGGWYDVYPHMYLPWYRNFWSMMEEVSVDRDTAFEWFRSVKVLSEGQFPSFSELIIGYRPKQALENLHHPIAPLDDMYVFAYAGIDLLAEHMDPTMRLHNMSLSGFLNSRPYMTKGAEEAYETYITRIWAIPAHNVSARDYQRYLGYCFAEADPVYGLTRGSAAAEVINPLQAALERAGVKIECGVQITRVMRADDRVGTIAMRRTKFNPRHYRWEPVGETWTEAVDELVLAVPASALTKLVRDGRKGQRIVEVDLRLAELSELRAARVPLLQLCFKRKLEGLPPQPVGLTDSRLNVAFKNISETPQGVPGVRDRTVLAVSCSNSGGLAGATWEENGHEILTELAQYLKFKPGAAWGESPQIDWQETRYNENYDTELTLNVAGTEVWRPPASIPELSNLAFAGDFCHGHIGLTTVESAVASGLNAANAILQRRGGDEFKVLEPNTLPDPLYMLMRYAFAPGAMAAKAWSEAVHHLRAEPGVPGWQPGAAEEESLVRYLLTPGLPPRHQRFDS